MLMSQLNKGTETRLFISLIFYNLCYFRQEEEEFLRMAAKDQQLVEQERMKLEDQLDEVSRKKFIFFTKFCYLH